MNNEINLANHIHEEIIYTQWHISNLHGAITGKCLVNQKSALKYYFNFIASGQRREGMRSGIQRRIHSSCYSKVGMA